MDNNIITCPHCNKEVNKATAHRNCGNCFSCLHCERYTCPHCAQEIVIEELKHTYKK